MVTMAEDEMLTPQEIAAKYRISVQTVRRHILAGRLKATRFGSKFRVQVRDLEAFLREQNKQDK